ncbi:MAG TPA: beta-ketoacyl-ACP synthase III [Chloroflexia bacterium]|nr:beta-ketoacyl-ACP synthase III [Chloroflexia bacterium]
MNSNLGTQPRAAITGLGVYLPPKVMTNRDLEQLVDTTDEWIVQRTGIRERRIAGPEDTTLTMAVAASRQALASANLDPARLDLIICATLIPEHPFPTTACLAQNALGATRAAAFDLSAACAGYVYALSVARAYIVSGMAENILVIGSETMSRVIDWQDRTTCVLFGDGAGAAVVQAVRGSNKGLGEIENVVLMSDGSKGDSLMIPAGGSRYPASEETVRNRMHYIKMNGSEVFKAAVRGMSEACLQAALQADIKLEDLDLVVAHQANARIIGAVQNRLGLPDSKVYQNLHRYGNTSGASIPIALYDAVREEALKPGMRVAVAGFGGGFAWGAAIIRWGNVSI